MFRRISQLLRKAKFRLVFKTQYSSPFVRFSRLRTDRKGYEWVSIHFGRMKSAKLGQSGYSFRITMASSVTPGLTQSWDSFSEFGCSFGSRKAYVEVPDDIDEENFLEELETILKSRLWKYSNRTVGRLRKLAARSFLSASFFLSHFDDDAYGDPGYWKRYCIDEEVPDNPWIKGALGLLLPHYQSEVLGLSFAADPDTFIKTSPFRREPKFRVVNHVPTVFADAFLICCHLIRTFSSNAKKNGMITFDDFASAEPYRAGHRTDKIDAEGCMAIMLSRIIGEEWGEFLIPTE